MQDPYLAVKDEVDHSLKVVVDLHARWGELRASGGGEEFDWTSSELLSGLRSIEWDLQDLEDTVSIVEGKLARFQLEESDVQARKDFIDETRRQIVAMRDEVSQQAGGSDVEAGHKGVGSGFSTGAGSSTSGIRANLPGSMGKKGKGYGKVGSMEDELSPAHEGGGAPRTALEVEDDIHGGDEILGDSASGPELDPARHRKKKICLLLTLLLLVGAAVGMAMRGPSVDRIKDVVTEQLPAALSGRTLAMAMVSRPQRSPPAPRPAAAPPPPRSRTKHRMKSSEQRLKTTLLITTSF